MASDIISRNRNKITTLYCIKKLKRFFINRENSGEKHLFLNKKIFDKYRIYAVFIENSRMF